jgi:hypothetical protein
MMVIPHSPEGLNEAQRHLVRHVIALLVPVPSRPDLVQFEKVEAERFDLRNDAEHCGPIFKQTGEHGLTALQLIDHRGEGGQSGSSESTPHPDRVQARQCGHTTIVQHELVSRQRRNQVITCTDTRAIAELLAIAGLRGAVAGVRVEQRPSDHPHRAWRRRCGCEC